MNPIPKDLLSIKGIGKALFERLQKAGINNLQQFQAKTKLPRDRAALAKAIRYDEKKVYVWSKHADLMRIKGIDSVAAEMLVSTGIRNVADLANADIKLLQNILATHFENKEEYINLRNKKKPSADNLHLWKMEAAQLKNDFVNDVDDEARVFIQQNAARLNKKLFRPFSSRQEQKTKKTEGAFFCDLSEMMIEIGRGIAEAQHELDKSSIAVQEYIESNEILRNYGLSATWYVMPETTFQMKVNYAVVQEETEEGERKGLVSKRMRVAPFNAKYQNLFKSTTNTESELMFKVVPVPAPVGFTEQVVVPNVLGLTVMEAESVIKDSRLLIGSVSRIDGSPDNEKETQVVGQSLEEGSQSRVNNIINLTYVRSEDIV